MTKNTTVKTNGSINATVPSMDLSAMIAAAVAEALAKAVKPAAVDNSATIAEIARLKAENAKLAAKPVVKKPAKLTIKVSQKGAVSIYGLFRFPVTLYREQMERLLDAEKDIRAFIKANESQLAVKGED